MDKPPCPLSILSNPIFVIPLYLPLPFLPIPLPSIIPFPPANPIIIRLFHSSHIFVSPISSALSFSNPLRSFSPPMPLSNTTILYSLRCTLSSGNSPHQICLFLISSLSDSTLSLPLFSSFVALPIQSSSFSSENPDSIYIVQLSLHYR